MEYWNNGVLGCFNILLPIFLCSIFLLFHYSILPVFQHSILPVFQHSILPFALKQTFPTVTEPQRKSTEKLMLK